MGGTAMLDGSVYHSVCSLPAASVVTSARSASLPPPFSLSLMQRNFQMYNRLPDYQLVRLAVTLLVGFIFGSIAWNQGADT